MIVLTPGSGAVVTSKVTTLRARVTGWDTPPTAGVFYLGSGRVPRPAEYNSSTQQWEVSFDTDTAPSGPGGQPADPYWNYACAIRFVASGGNRVEESAQHWFFVMTYADSSQPEAFAYRSVLDWDTPFSTFATGEDMESFYRGNGGSGIGEYMTTIVNRNGRKFAVLRPDSAFLASGERDQPTAGGIRCQFGTLQEIDKGDYVVMVIAFMVPEGNAEPTDEDDHANAVQLFGPDSNGPSSYNMGTPFALNMSARTKIDGSKILSDKGVLYSTGNKTNPGLPAPLLYKKLVPGKEYVVAVELWVSPNPQRGKIRILLDEGNGLLPVRQPIAYPGTDDYTLSPFVAQTPFHGKQRWDIQTYRERETANDFAYMFSHHKIGGSVAAVDPVRYTPSVSLPEGYAIDRSVPMRFRRGDVVVGK